MFAAADFPVRDDGVYVVRVYAVEDRHHGRLRQRWRTDGYYAGHRAGTLTRATFGRRQDADACAETLWTDYLAGCHDAPEGAPLTVGELVDRFTKRTLSKRGRELSAKTPRSYRSQLASLIRVTGADWPLGHLTRRHVEAVLRAPRVGRLDKHGAHIPGSDAKPLSKRTVAQTLQAMKSLVNWALKQGWLTTDITADVVFDAGPEIMRSWLQPREIEPFLTACPPAFRIRAGLVIETGMRASEAANLRWSWIQQGVGRPSIRIPARDPETGFEVKGKRARAIPLSERGQAFLREAAARWGDTGFVLHAQAKAPDTANWCRDVHAACARAGVKDTDMHGLRRTAGSIWLASGVDIFRVSKLLGHASVTVTERCYAGFADGHLDAAMDAVDDRAAATGGIREADAGADTLAARTVPVVRRQPSR